MKNIKISLIAMALWLCTACSAKAQLKNHGSDGFAVIELFTSEGCSSCPAAEKVLSQLQNTHNKNVYVLEFHVDYWNYLGWNDAFSSQEYTERQQNYARIFKLGSTYTPQAIVNGQSQLVGSDKNKLESIIQDGLNTRRRDSIRITAKLVSDKIHITWNLNNSDELLNIALVQKKAETHIKRGENAGKTLVHTKVVRAFLTIPTKQNSGNLEILLPGGLSAAECSLIAFTQVKENWRTTAAAEAEIE